MNKTDKTMNNDINIAEILRDCPRGMKLYSPIYGEVELNKVLDSGDIFVYLDAGQYMTDRIKSFRSDGKFAKGGEHLLFPSASMRDWSRFFKRGDVLVCGSRLCVFKEWVDGSYTRFRAAYLYGEDDGGYYDVNCECPTGAFSKVTDRNVIDALVERFEEFFHGKFNAEKLEIEKSFEPKNGDFICFNDADICRHYAIFRSMSCQYLYYHASVSPNGTWFLVNTAFVRTFNGGSNIFNLRLATEAEKQVLLSSLEKNGKKWNTEKLCIEDIPKKVQLKPFDRVLARDEEEPWCAEIFGHYSRDTSEYICVGGVYDECVPYNDRTARLLGTKDPYTEEGGAE